MKAEIKRIAWCVLRVPAPGDSMHWGWRMSLRLVFDTAAVRVFGCVGVGRSRSGLHHERCCGQECPRSETSRRSKPWSICNLADSRASVLRCAIEWNNCNPRRLRFLEIIC